jgi:glycosyltransferase involved in cell wall biosynthesis
MSKAPQVSIVIPTYNSAAYLRAAIESVRAQTFADWELVLFDDGSSDSTVELAEELARGDERIRVVPGGHCGTAAARNGGFRETHPGSEFVAFLDSDDIWEPSALELLVNALDEHPECPAAHGLARGVNERGERVEGDDLADQARHRRAIHDGRFVDLPVSEPTSFEAELVVNYVVTPGTSLIRRHVFESLGGFDAAAVPAEDWEMNLRIARRGGFALVDHVILNWRRHPNSASNTSKRNRRARLVVWQRTIQSTENTPLQRRAAWWALYSELRSQRAAVGQALMHRQMWATGKTLMLMLLYYRLVAQLFLTSRVSRVARAR